VVRPPGPGKILAMRLMISAVELGSNAAMRRARRACGVMTISAVPWRQASRICLAAAAELVDSKGEALAMLNKAYSLRFGNNSL
jgi:hypothetical protein